MERVFLREINTAQVSLARNVGLYRILQCVKARMYKKFSKVNFCKQTTTEFSTRLEGAVLQ